MAPHDAARLVLDQRVVHRLESALSVDDRVEVDVRVAERAARDRVTAHTDRSDWAHRIEKLEEQSLRDLRVQVANVEGSRRERVLHLLFFSARGRREARKRMVVSTGSGGSGSTGKKQAQCGRLTWFLGVPILSARSSCARRGTARGTHTRGQTNRTHARAPVAVGACCASASTASDRFAATTAPGRHQPSEQHRVCVACDATRLQRSPPQAAGRDTQPNGHRRGARARIEDSDLPWDGCSTSQVFHVIGLIAARHDAVIHAFIGRSPSGSPARCTTGEGFFCNFPGGPNALLRQTSRCVGAYGRCGALLS